MTKPTVSKHWRKPVGRWDQAWIPPEPLHHVTIIQLSATSSTHSVRVPMWQTQYVGPVRTAHISVLWTVNILYHTIQHRAVLIIFPLNLQTITTTRMLSSGGEGDNDKHDDNNCSLLLILHAYYSKAESKASSTHHKVYLIIWLVWPFVRKSVSKIEICRCVHCQQHAESEVHGGQRQLYGVTWRSRGYALALG